MDAQDWLTQATSWNWLSERHPPAGCTMDEEAIAVGSLEYVNMAASPGGPPGGPPAEPCATCTPASWAGLMWGLSRSTLLLGSEAHLYRDCGA